MIIDLFAHKFDTQLRRYILPCYDSFVVLTDAVMSPWPSEVWCLLPTTIFQLVGNILLQKRLKFLLLLVPNDTAAA